MNLADKKNAADLQFSDDAGERISGEKLVGLDAKLMVDRSLWPEDTLKHALGFYTLWTPTVFNSWLLTR